MLSTAVIGMVPQECETRVEKNPKRRRKSGDEVVTSATRCGAQVLLINGLGQLLVVLEKKKQVWNPPGGSVGVTRGELPIDGALREMKEEAGIDLASIDYTYVGKVFCNTFYTYVYFTKSTPVATPNSRWNTGDIAECMWLDKEPAFPGTISYVTPGDAGFKYTRALALTSEKGFILKAYNGATQCDAIVPQPVFQEQTEAEPIVMADIPVQQQQAEPIDMADIPEQQAEPIDMADIPEQQAEPKADRRKTQKFTEVLSLAGLQFLCKLSFSDFLQIWEKDAEETDENGDTMTLTEQYQLMQEFCKSSMQTGKVVTINSVDAVEIVRVYMPTHSSPTGRFFANGDRSTGLALQRLWTKVRSVLTREFTVDLDMKNAHPTILLAICETQFAHEEFWQSLKHYVESRDAVINELKTAGVRNPKKMVLTAMNSAWPRAEEIIKQGSRVVFRKKIPKSCQLYHELDACFKCVQKRLETLPVYRHLHPGKRENNRLGVLLNRICCENENAYLQEAMSLVGFGQVAAPMFDGMLVRGQHEDVENRLAALNHRFKHRMIWDYKEHDNEITVDPGYVGKNSFIADTDVKVLDMLVGHFSGKLARCRGALWFLGDRDTTVILPGDRTQNTAFERCMIAELRKCEIFVGETDQCEAMASLRALCLGLTTQAPVDDEFETRYWESAPDDDYSRGILHWNSRCIHLLHKSVFLYELDDGVEELKPEELQRNMSAITPVSFDQWCASTQHRVYDKDVFVPSLKPELQNPKHYNMFKGLGIQYHGCKDADMSACKPLLAHIETIVCKGNEAASNFVLKTLARIVQGVEHGRLDWVKSEVCILFLSKQGAGKGTLTRHIRRIIGKAYAKQITKKKDLFGNFNDYTSCKLWIEMDELLWAGNHEQAGEFKNMISEDEQTCEGKYKKTREYDSYHNYCATTNNDWAAQVDSDNRRFAPIDCDNKYAGPRTPESTAYFSRLRDPKLGPYKIAEAFAKYLYELDVEEFAPAEHIPNQTLGMQQQKLQSLSTTEAILENWLSRGYAYTGVEGGVKWGDANERIPRITNSALWVEVKQEHGRDRGFPENELKFFQALAKTCGDTKETLREKGSRYNYFKPLCVMKHRFNEFIGFEHYDSEETVTLQCENIDEYGRKCMHWRCKDHAYQVCDACLNERWACKDSLQCL